MCANTSIHALTEGFSFLRHHPRVFAFGVDQGDLGIQFRRSGFVQRVCLPGVSDGRYGHQLALRRTRVWLVLRALVAAIVLHPAYHQAIHMGGDCGLGLVYRVGYAMWALSPYVLLGALGIFIGHLGGGNLWTYSRIYVQREAPNRIRGRVMSLDSVSFSLVTGVYAFVIGAVAGYTTPTWGVLTGVLTTLVLGLVWCAYMWRTVLKSND